MKLLLPFINLFNLVTIRHYVSLMNRNLFWYRMRPHNHIMKCGISLITAILIFVTQIPEYKNWAQLVRDWGVSNFQTLFLKSIFNRELMKLLKAGLLWLKQGSSTTHLSPLLFPGGNLLTLLGSKVPCENQWFRPSIAV